MLKICRACLTEEGEMQSVFVPDEKTGSHIHLAEMIMAYASVQVTVYSQCYKHFWHPLNYSHIIRCIPYAKHANTLG